LCIASNEIIISLIICFVHNNPIRITHKMTSLRLTLTLMMVAITINVGQSVPIFDTIAQFGNSIKNNPAIESLSLQLVPMSTRIKMAAYRTYYHINFVRL
jgi:hypothetical protein